MSLLTLNEIHVSFGPQIVLDNVSLTVHPGDRIGVVGPNGAGKSTLFRVILRQTIPSIGGVFTARGLRVGHQPQEVAPPADVTLGEYLRSAFAGTDKLAGDIQHVGDLLSQADADEQPALLKRLAQLQTQLDAAGGYHYESKIGLIRDGLNLGDIEPDRPMTAMSGGQLSRAALARLLLTDPDLLLLDEPTNHLDLASTEWLERFLIGFSGAMMVISHDRYLLDKIVDKIVDVRNRGARLYGMRFRDYVVTREIQELQQQREYEKQQDFIAKERDFIARFNAGQRAKEARGRRTRLERRIADGELTTQAVREKKKLNFEFNIDQPGGEMIVRCSDLGKRFGQRVLLDKFNLDVTRGQKLGILGANGTGKTTLLKILLGQVEPDSGKARLMENLDVGYLDQHQATLNENLTVLDTAHLARPQMEKAKLRGLVAHFGFPGDMVDKQVGSLSGGEQSRVALACMVLKGHQVLMLDEPTNHLDMASREALEDALVQYPGTLIVVSHDRYFLDRVVSRILVFNRDGCHAAYDGNYSTYQQMLAERAREAETLAAENRVKARKLIRRSGSSSGPAAGSGPTDPLEKLSVSKLETRIMELEAELEQLHAQCADPLLYQQPARLAALTGRTRELQAELTRYNAAWERRADG